MSCIFIVMNPMEIPSGFHFTIILDNEYEEVLKMENKTFVCSHCGNEHPLDIRILVGDESICEDCALEHTVHCDCCNTRIWEEDAIRDEHTLLCERCYEHSYSRCTECDRIIPNSEAYFDDDNDVYCEDCWNEMVMKNKPCKCEYPTKIMPY